MVDLDELARADRDTLLSTTRELARARRLTVGVSRQPPASKLLPLAEALTCTLAVTEVGAPLPRSMVPTTDVARSLAALREAVERSPQASIALAMLLRQTAQLDPEAGLGAEAAVYSMLLGGREFHRWLEVRGAPRPPGLHDSRLRVERAGEQLSVVLTRPERRNALDAAMREQLYEALFVAMIDPSIRRVVLSGAGPSFCAGGDLDEFGTARDVVAAFYVRLESAPWRLLERMRERVEARVHGATIGAGIELAAFAGRVTAAPNSSFQLPEAAMGLVPGAGGTVSIPRRIGRWRAAWLMLTGASLDAQTALDWGLVDSVGAQA